MPIETFNHAKSTDAAQNTQACGYELTFVENKKFVNSKGHRTIRSKICHPPRSGFEYGRKIELEILHIFVYLV